MVLLDFEKAYDRIEWEFVIRVLERLGFPPSFYRWVKILFKDSNMVIQVNGELSILICLRRSIRQGCPLAPSLFVLIVDSLSYIWKANELGPSMKGISLPNNDILLLEQFTDDTTMFFQLTEGNFEIMMSRMQLYCSVLGAKISTGKSPILGLSDSPLDWIRNQEWQWSGPKHTVRYLGIPFSIEPSLKDMRSWIYAKIENKHLKWQARVLSIAGRARVVQKVLSSYIIYYASSWLFAKYQTNTIEKNLRHFLWSDGHGNKKRHNVKWERCCYLEKLGGLGMRDIKNQGIALAGKWVLNSLEGSEPWKILVQNNISRAIIKKGKH